MKTRITSIRRKVGLTLFVAFALALATAAATLSIFEYRSAETRARTTLESLADSLAFSLVASLDFDQPDVAAQNLSRLEPSRTVLGAAVFRVESDGVQRAFANYRRAGQSLLFPQELRPEGFYRDADRALLVYPLHSENQTVGWLLLETDVGAFRRGVRESLVVLGVVLLVLALVSVVLSRFLQRGITAPIVQLAETAARVHATGDFSLRSPVAGADEVGQLATSFNGMLEGIAERDQRIAASSAFQRAILEATDVAVFSTDLAGTITTFNPAAERLLGYTAGDVVGKSTPSLWHDHAETVQHAATLSRELGVSIAPDAEALTERPRRRLHETGEWTFIRKDGRRVPVFLVMSALRDATGTITGYCGLANDLTERRATEEALRHSRTLLDDSQRIAHIGSWEMDLATRIAGWSDEAYRILGHEPRSIDLTTESYLAHVFPEDRASVAQRIATVRMLTEYPTSEYRIVRPDGTIRWVLVTGAIGTDLSGQPVRIFGSVQDVTERKAAEESLRTNEERFRSLIADASDMITVMNHESIVTFQSPSSERVLGYTPEEMTGRKGFDFVHPSDHARTQAMLGQAMNAPGTPVTLEVRLRRRDGTWRLIEAVGRCVADKRGEPQVILNARDITESRRLEEQLRQSQKMEAIGQLSGGVAHDFNNILTVIQGNVTILQMAEQLSPEASESLAEIRLAAERAANLTRQLLAFSRRQTMQLRSVDLNEVAASLTRMLERIVGEDVQMQVVLAPRPATVQADVTMMEQVLLNLVVNSRDAMPTGGRLVIETAIIELDAVAAGQVAHARAGTFVRLSVSDTGSGIAPDVLPRIFEPFFTTKGVGKGTGLGLATVFGIVEQHQGWINAYSETGLGTTFRVYLPHTGTGAGAPALNTDRNDTGTRTRGGNETILLVEDEPALRTLGRRILERLGYRVFDVGSGKQALEFWKENKSVVHLLLTDMVMPDGMTGRELALRLRAESPTLRVIYTSGYSPEIAAGDFAFEEGVNFLAKPFLPETLALIVRASLDGMPR